VHVHMYVCMYVDICMCVCTCVYGAGHMDMEECIADLCMHACI
jgi:hypothetical protein